MTDSIVAEDKTLYVMVSDDLIVYEDRSEAIKALRSELAENEDASVAKLWYEDADGDDDVLGRFKTEQIGWREIAVGMADEE